MNYFSYSSLKGDFAYTDTEDGRSDDVMTCLWTDVTTGFSQGNFNREHVWPKSHASFYQHNGGSDRHHLRPVSGSVNQQAHWHRPYGTATGGMIAYGENGDYGGLYTTSGGSQGIGYFEPADNAKGDTARILLYIYVRWQQPNLYSDIAQGNLPALDSDDSANDGLRVIESLDTLLAWCEMDPVDTWEMSRNDSIERIQGNRNVFIDYPELAWQLFGEEVPAGMSTPTAAGCQHEWEILSQREASCTEDGEIVRRCNLCHKEQTEVLKATGHVDGDDNGICDVCGLQIRSEQQFALTEELTEGDLLVLYNLFEGKTLSMEENADQVESIPVEPQGDVLYAPTGTAIFQVKYQAGSTTDFYLISNGSYLSTAESGNCLTYAPQAGDYSLWYLEKNPMGSGYFIRSRNAAYGGKYNQAIEYYSDRFAVYGISSSTSTNRQFSFELYIAADDTNPCPDGHSPAAPVIENRTEPTCTECGSYDEVVCCAVCGQELSRKTVSVDATGHTPAAPVYENKVEPTCTEKGSYDEVVCCAVCGQELSRKTVTVDAIGHLWGEWEVLTAPTHSEEGKRARTCERCGEISYEAIPATDCPSEAFLDVSVLDWFHDSVDYMVEMGLMNGVGDEKFDPDGTMTRAMLVTVLWRYAGEPKEGVNGFDDVPEGQWYTQAVAWAVENGIANGVSETEFEPESDITREQMAAILYRYAASIGIDTGKRADLSTFPDGDQTSEYALEALSWANAEGLITGSDEDGLICLLFQGNATRAQVATILMRFIEGVA